MYEETTDDIEYRTRPPRPYTVTNTGWPPDEQPEDYITRIGVMAENTRSVNDAGEDTNQSIDDTLVERGNRYGPFSKHAAISQELQHTLFATKAQSAMPAYINEALTLICHKLARIVNGDHMYDDNFRDIAGYSQLVVDILNGKDT